MSYPEHQILPDHLVKVAAIERFAGSWGKVVVAQNERALELRSRALLSSTSAMLRLEGCGTTVGAVEETMAHLAHRELDLRKHAEEVASLHAALSEYTADGADFSGALQGQVLPNLHQTIFHEVANLRVPPGKQRDRAHTVQAFDAEGYAIGDVFTASPPEQIGALVSDTFVVMRKEIEAVKWHPLFLISWITGRLLAIHPFDIGSIRTCLVLADILLLAEGYSYTRLESLSAQVEKESGAFLVALRRYARSMMGDQSGILDWHSFFLGALVKQAHSLSEKLQMTENEVEEELPPLTSELKEFVEEKGKATLRQACEHTGANRNTVKVHLRKLVDLGHLRRHGSGKGTWYSPMPKEGEI